MNEMESQNHPVKKKTNTNKLAASIGIAVVILAVAYSVAAYSYHLWPFPGKPVPSDTLKTVEASMLSKPTFKDKDGVEVLRTVPAIETMEQGDCTLVLSNDKNTYTFKNSTRGVEGIFGCLEWNIGVESYPAGTYDLEVTFVGDTERAIIRDKVTIQ